MLYTPRELKIGNQILYVSRQVRDLGLNHSFSLNFLEYALTQVAKANQLMELHHWAINYKENEPHLFRTHVRHILGYCSLIRLNMRLCNRVVIENIQSIFTKQLIGYSVNRNFMGRFRSLSLDPLWLWRTRPSPVLFNDSETGNSCNSAPRVRNPSQYSLWSAELIITLPVPTTSVGANFYC